MALPAFSSLWAKYPTGGSDEVKRLIGGNVNASWITNTCVIRVSHAFNGAGEPIPGGWPGLTTVRGGNGKRYAFRVAEFKPFLEQRYKPADITGKSAADFSGQTGIIMFDVQGWSDATGHFDLWDGSNPRHGEYFANASQVLLWKCD